MAASWAILKCMGQDGYLEMAKKLMKVTDHIKNEVESNIKVTASMISIESELTMIHVCTHIHTHTCTCTRIFLLDCFFMIYEISHISFYRTCPQWEIPIVLHLPLPPLINKLMSLCWLISWKRKVNSTNLTVSSTLCAFLTGWKLERAQKSLHFTILPSHTIESSNQLLADLRSCIDTAKVSQCFVYGPQPKHS